MTATEVNFAWLNELDKISAAHWNQYNCFGLAKQGLQYDYAESSNNWKVTCPSGEVQYKSLVSK